jgi:hypothetical protein
MVVEMVPIHQEQINRFKMRWQIQVVAVVAKKDIQDILDLEALEL